MAIKFFANVFKILRTGTISICENSSLKNFCRASGLLRLRRSGRLKNDKNHSNKGCQHSSNYNIKKGRINYICQTPGMC